MSLFGSIQLAGNALRATTIGIHTVGQNIANANTPGYLREEVVFEPAPTQRVGDLLLGLGVDVTGIVQKVDRFLEGRVRSAISDRAASETQGQAFLELEQILGELNDTDLSTAMNKFFGSIQEVLNQPESAAVRNLTVLEGAALAESITRIDDRIRVVRADFDERVRASAGDINRLTEEIRRLNVQIAETEGGGVSASDAVGLRDQRGVALSNLAALVDIRTDEQASGAVNVSVGGTFLVFEGQRNMVDVDLVSDRGAIVANIQFADTGFPLAAGGGQLAGLIAARDQIVGGFLDQLDEFARALIFEFNKLHSSGQGLSGYQSLVSESAVADVDAALDVAGLPFTPVNGSFQVLVFNRQTGLTQTTDVLVDLNGLDGDDTTFRDLVTELNAIDGLAAEITPTRGVRLVSDSPDQDFAFAGDTSGVLAALGINTFFRGSSAGDIAVRDGLRADPGKFAASRGGVGADTDNAVELATFADRELDSTGGPSVAVLYDRLVAGVTQGASVNGSITEGFRLFEENLLGQHLSISGVSLDDEALRLIQYQTTYQATARYISTLNDLLNVLVEL